MSAAEKKPLFTKTQEEIDEAFMEETGLGQVASSRGDRHILDKDNSWQNYVPPARMKLSHRQARFAELMFLGKTQTEAAETCGYTTDYASSLAKTPAVLEFIEGLRENSFAKPVEERLKNMGTLALDTMEQLLLDPNVDITKKESAAKWVAEMQVGKANQKVSVSGQMGIGVFLDRLDNLKNVTPAPKQVDSTKEVIEAEPAKEPEEEGDDFAQWLDKNL